MHFRSPGNPFVPPADNLTIPQAFIDARLDHLTRPRSVAEPPTLIEEHTGRNIYREEVGGLVLISQLMAHSGVVSSS